MINYLHPLYIAIFYFFNLIESHMTNFLR